MNLLERMITEGRLNDVERKHPLLATKYNGESLIDKFSENDPSGNNKYLMWMAHAFMHLFTIAYRQDYEGESEWKRKKDEPTVKFRDWLEERYKEHLKGFITGISDRNTSDFDPESVIQIVGRFHALLPFVKNKDIYSKEYLTSIEKGESPFWKLEEELQDAKTRELVAKEKKALKKAKKAGAKSGSEVVYEAEGGSVVAVRVYTPKAACFYGQQTRWCIASTKDSHFEDYTDNGFAFYYILNPKSENRDFRKFAVLFNPARAEGDQYPPPQNQVVVFNSEPIPVVEIFDASDSTVSPTWVYKAIADVKGLGEFPDPGQISFARQDGEFRTSEETGFTDEFDKMMNTMAAHAKANPPPILLQSYTEKAMEERDGAGALSWVDFRAVHEPDERGEVDVMSGLTTTRKVREKVAARAFKPMMTTLPLGIFATLLKALVTPTGDMKLGRGSDGLPQTNMNFYAKLRNQYIEKIREIAEKHLADYVKSFKLSEDNRRLFDLDDESDNNMLMRANIKDLRFSVQNEERIHNGVYRPRPGNDRVTRLRNSSDSMTTAFDQMMYSLVNQWEGNPNAEGTHEGNEHTVAALHKFARQRYNASIHFRVEFPPVDTSASRTFGKKDLPVPNDGRQKSVPHPMEPQFYILSNKEEVDKYISDIEEFEDHFYVDYKKTFRQKIRQADLYKHGTATGVSGFGKQKAMQQRLDFSKKFKGIGPESALQESIEKTYDKWHKIIKK